MMTVVFAAPRAWLAWAANNQKEEMIMKAIGWNVYLNGKQIDTVWFDADMTAEQVYRALVEHDGYNPQITVRK